MGGRKPSHSPPESDGDGSSVGAGGGVALQKVKSVTISDRDSFSSWTGTSTTKNNDDMYDQHHHGSAINADPNNFNPGGAEAELHDITISASLGGGGGVQKQRSILRNAGGMPYGTIDEQRFGEGAGAVRDPKSYGLRFGAVDERSDEEDGSVEEEDPPEVRHLVSWLDVTSSSSDDEDEDGNMNTSQIS